MITANIFLTDDLGNVGSGVVAITMQPATPLKLNVNISPLISTSPEGTPLSFTISSTGLNPVITWSVSKDGSLYSSGIGNVVRFTPSDAGNYIINGFAVAGNLSGSVSQTVTITNVAPVPKTNGPYASLTGQSINFIGNVFDPGTLDTFTWLWNFGDGTTSTLQNPTHVYNSAGSYTITLTVTDQRGASGSVTSIATITSIVPPLSGISTAQIGLTPNPLNEVLQPGQALAINYILKNAKSAQLLTPSGPINIPVDQNTLSANGTLNYVPNQPGIGNVSCVLLMQAIDPSGYPVVHRFNAVVQDQSILPPLDPTALPSFSTIKSGLWTDSSVWNGGIVPMRDSIVSINAGHIINASGRNCQAGRLIIKQGGTFNLKNGAYYVTDIDAQNGSTFNLGDGLTPALVILRNRKKHVNDVNDFWRCVNIADGATFNSAGSIVTRLSRLVGDAKAGDTKLVLQTPVSGWDLSNKFYLADTDQDQDISPTQSKFEICQVRAVSSDGNTVYLLDPLKYDHVASYDSTAQRYRTAHVGNLICSVGFITTDPTDTTTCAHFWTTGKAIINMAYTIFHGLGRSTKQPTSATNPSDRICCNLKHLIGPSGGLPAPYQNYQYRAEGCVFIDPWPVVPVSNKRWGLNISDSHYGYIQNNISFNWYGAGFHFEKGNESYNLFKGNAAFYIVGNGGRGDFIPPGGSIADLGLQGAGIWIRGPMNYIQNNVAANCYKDGTFGPYAYGMVWFFGYISLGLSPNLPIPKFQGADTNNSAESTVININYTPLLANGCVENEIYSSIYAWTYWYVGMDESAIPKGVAESKFTNFRCWHIRYLTLFPYPSDHLTLDGMDSIGSLAKLRQGSGSTGIDASDYAQSNFLAQNIRFENLYQGIGVSQSVQNKNVPNPMVLNYKNSKLACCTCIFVRTQFSSGYKINDMTGRAVNLDNVVCDISNMPSIGGVAPLKVRMDYMPNFSGSRTLIGLDRILFTKFGGVPTDNFHCYYNQQTPNFVPPTTILNSDGTISTLGQPPAGTTLPDGIVSPGNLTNAQLVSHRSNPIGGEVAPANAVNRPGIQGLCA